MNTLPNRLQLGFAIYIAGSFTLFLQFFLYLLQSNIASTTDFAGYGYYLVAAFAHAGLFALIPYLLYILMSLACPFPRFNQGLLITFYFLLNIIAYLNGLVFQLYKFHINGLVLDMVFGQDAGQVFNFETSLILRFALTILAVGFLFSGIIWIAYRFYQRLRRRQIILYLVLFVCSTLSAHLVHAYAAASNQFSIQCRNLPATILSIDCKQVNGKIRNYPSPGFLSATERQHHSQYRYHLSVTSVDFK